MRQRYKKIYEDYKPTYMFYKEVLLCRKLLFAVIVTLNRSVEMQCVSNEHGEAFVTCVSMMCCDLVAACHTATVIVICAVEAPS